MAKVSKRLRFEIFRRDNHTCRYCGRSAPEVTLTIDHVVPEVLGGGNEPSNLVTACQDCNSGKTSMPPDAPIVEDVQQEAARWARAINLAARSMVEERWEAEQRNAQFAAQWQLWTHGPSKKPIPLPADWGMSLEQLRTAGLNDELISHAIEIAMNARGVEIENTFRYFCGVAWRMVGEMQERAKLIAETMTKDN